MKIIENIQKILKKTNQSDKHHENTRTNIDKKLSEQLAEDRQRRKRFEEKLLEEIQAKNRDEERVETETRLTEYLAEKRKSEKLFEEKVLEELQTKRKNDKERIQQIKNFPKDLKKAIRREQSTINKRELEEIQIQKEIEAAEIALCTCDTTPDSEKILCGYCRKLMCRHCWEKHQFSHGRTDSISITHHSNGKMTGRL